MATSFKPSDQQQRLIAEASALSEKAVEPGHYAPDELVQRMSLEEQCAASLAEEDSAATPGQPPRTATQGQEAQETKVDSPPVGRRAGREDQ